MTGVVHRFDIAALPASPWKNGGGSTQEIACWPPGAGFDAFEWRVSIATIAASGPFSVFHGVNRIIALLEGDGVQLRGDGIDHRLSTPLAPFAFSGDVRVDCTLLGGASSDFNVMTRRERGTARLDVLRGAVRLQPATHGLLLNLRGQWQAGKEVLQAGQGLWWAQTPRATPLEPRGKDSVLISVVWSAQTR